MELLAQDVSLFACTDLLVGELDLLAANSPQLVQEAVNPFRN
jgi:hypothetical protein